jgi:transcriptional regulator with GAF, ATPase, and Fis domain
MCASNHQTITSPELDGGGGLVRIRHLHVVMAPRELPTTMVPLLSTSLVIGRDAEGANTLGLPDHECSRQHARVELDPARDVWRVVDLGSRNGVWVDGVRVSEADLSHGRVIRLGSSLIVFTDTELAPDQPLASERAGLLGRSLAMQRVRGEIDLIGPRDVSVVILGETGVGKERVAEDLHRVSKRRGAFVPVNCAAIPSSVAESELFGHGVGAFTGATTRHEGLFGAAHGGTLFLDEIGELSTEVQAKLLRALAVGEVRSLGITEQRIVDVRVIAATHVDLDAQIAAGGFRGDIWARLAGWRIDIPPLRQRREDVLGLAAAFLPGAARLSPSAAEALLLYDWPYNVRELNSLMTTAALRPTDGVIRLEHLPAAIAGRVAHRTRKASATEPPLEAMVDKTRTPGRAELELVLRRMSGSVALTAEFFGKDRRQIYRWLERHGIDPEQLRPAKDDDERG